MGVLDGLRGLVTGGAYGIGRASALGLAAAGAQVAVLDVDEVRGHETVETICRAGGTAIFVRTDVADEDQVAAAVETTVSEFGRLDFAHNNAAISPVTGNTVECTRETWDAVMAVNLTGVWLCMKHEIPHMVRQGGGAVVNTSSGVGTMGMSNQPAYVTSKHGIIGITRAAAMEFASQGVRVNAVCPGPVLSGLTEKGIELGKYTMEGLASLTPMGLVAQPEDVAASIVWLCSPAARIVTGAALPVDGGLTAGLPTFGAKA